MVQTFVSSPPTHVLTGMAVRSYKKPRPSTLYLNSVALRDRHGTHGRLRVSLSTTARLIAESSLAGDAEIIVVDYNPCHLRDRPHVAGRYADSNSCRGAAEGRQYLSIANAVRARVEAPRGAHAAARIRIISISESQHETVYNPHGLDLLEFVGKNAAARRARGRFLLFTNPDDCWSEALAQLLADRRLRTDVFYTSIRGQVVSAVPAGEKSSAASMLDFVWQHNYDHIGDDSPDEHVSKMPRAACGYLLLSSLL
jgi:hypothetical protein